MPLFISPITGNFTVRRLSLGALGDSYYEYLLKMWLVQGKQYEVYRAMWEQVGSGLGGGRGGCGGVVWCGVVHTCCLAKPSTNLQQPPDKCSTFCPACSPACVWQAMDEMIERLVFTSTDRLTYVAEFERCAGWLQGPAQSLLWLLMLMLVPPPPR
jgi:hypothetical protein